MTTASELAAFLRGHHVYCTARDGRFEQAAAELDRLSRLSPSPDSGNARVLREARALVAYIDAMPPAETATVDDAVGFGAQVELLRAALASTAPVPTDTADLEAVREAAFQIGDRVTKTKGSRWTGRIVGTYSTALTPEGYAIESENEPGSVQIYPASAIRSMPLPGEKV